MLVRIKFNYTTKKIINKDSIEFRVTTGHDIYLLNNKYILIYLNMCFNLMTRIVFLKGYLIINLLITNYISDLSYYFQNVLEEVRPRINFGFAL